MIRSRLTPRRIVGLCLLVAVFGTSDGAAAAGVSPLASPGPLRLLDNTQGVSLSEVLIDLQGSTGDPQRDASLGEQARDLVGMGAGERFNELIADSAMLRIRRISGVRSATYRLQARINPDTVALVVTVKLETGEAAVAEPSGVFPERAIAPFPVLYRSDRSLVRVILNGGSGVFTDGNPWFGNPATFTRGNPLVQDPAVGAGTRGRATWIENYAEYGLGGSMQVGDSPYYLYGAATALTAMSAGRDIFRDDTRWTTNIEDLYAGLLYVSPRTGMKGNMSIGRQNFTLNDGFLISQYGSQYNAGPRPGVYLAPRTAHDFAALGQATIGRWTLQGFYLDPNEYEPIESNTRVAGTNLRYTVTPQFYGDATLIQVPQSATRYLVPDGPPLGRAGLTTLAAHLRWSDRRHLSGVWTETEVAHQTNEHFPMSAWAGYGTLGYLASAWPWNPSLSYRYAYFSGDDPRSSRYERFDPLFSGGLSEWLQGISLAKALSQGNRASHRVRFNVSPMAGVDLTLDYFLHFADEFNNRGGNPALSQLSSKDLGHELQLVARWSISRNLYFLGVAASAWPGAAVRQATPDGAAKPWSSFQAQVFWNF